MKKNTMSPCKLDDNRYNDLISNISELIVNARKKVNSHINTVMLETYWAIGRFIVEYEQGGQAKVAYGSSTLTQLSHSLTLRFGKGFSRPNLTNMRKFYLTYPNCQTLSDNFKRLSSLPTIEEIENTLNNE